MRQFGPLVGSNWFISVLVLVLLCLVTYSSAGNCSDVQAVVLEREGTRWVVSASDVTVYPLAYGQLIPETYFRWSLTTLVERNRTTRDSDGFSIQPRCVDPSCPPEQFFCILDPIEPHVDDTPCTGRVANPCGALAHAMFTKDMNCYLQHYTAPFHGFERETVSITFSHPDYPDMKVVAENHLLNGDFEYYPIPGQPILVNRYRYGVKEETHIFLSHTEGGRE